VHAAQPLLRFADGGAAESSQGDRKGSRRSHRCAILRRWRRRAQAQCMRRRRCCVSWRWCCRKLPGRTETAFDVHIDVCDSAQVEAAGAGAVHAALTLLRAPAAVRRKATELLRELLAGVAAAPDESVYAAFAQVHGGPPQTNSRFRDAELRRLQQELLVGVAAAADTSVSTAFTQVRLPFSNSSIRANDSSCRSCFWAWRRLWTTSSTQHEKSAMPHLESTVLSVVCASAIIAQVHGLVVEPSRLSRVFLKQSSDNHRIAHKKIPQKAKTLKKP